MESSGTTEPREAEEDLNIGTATEKHCSDNSKINGIHYEVCFILRPHMFIQPRIQTFDKAITVFKT